MQTVPENWYAPVTYFLRKIFQGAWLISPAILQPVKREITFFEKMSLTGIYLAEIKKNQYRFI